MTISDAEARQCLEKVLASESFKRSKRSRELLRYLADTVLSGRVAEMKAYSIAIDVFGRDQNFDSETDALVRVQAGRLRDLLCLYYETEGVKDLVRVDLPKGGYIPVFKRVVLDKTVGRELPGPGLLQTRLQRVVLIYLHKSMARSRRLFQKFGAEIALALLTVIVASTYILKQYQAKPPSSEAVIVESNDKISIALLPISSLLEDRQTGHPADVLYARLSYALSRDNSIALSSPRLARTVATEPDTQSIARKFNVRFLLEGRLIQENALTVVNMNLSETTSNTQVWAQTYERRGGALPEQLENIANTIASDLHLILQKIASKQTEHKLSSRQSEIAASKPVTPRDYFVLSTYVPSRARNSLAWEKERVSLAESALRLDPDYGPALSVLADKLAYLATVDPPSDSESQRQKADQFARRAIEAASAEAGSVFNISIHYWHIGRIEESMTFTRRTLELAPNHPLAKFLVKVVPYTCSDVPQSVIDELVLYDSLLPSSNPERWVTLTWISLLYLNNGDFRRAAEFGWRSYAIFRTPNSIYRLAAALAKLGEATKARALINAQREFWPNMSPEHYANVTIPRRCRDGTKSEFLTEIYRHLASVVATDK